MKRLFSSLLFLILTMFSAQSQHITEAGKPFIHYYGSNTYRGHPQNWCSIQDKSGIIFFGNNQNLLQFDGQHWEIMEGVLKSSIRDMVIDDKGKLFLCGNEELSVLEVGKNGTPQIKSVLDQMGEQHRSFGEIRRALKIGRSLYFFGTKKILKYENGNFISWDARTLFRKGFYVNNRLFSQEDSIGLVEIVAGKIRDAEGGNFFVDKTIFFMLPYSSSYALVGTQENGIFLYDMSEKGHQKNKVIPFHSAVDQYIIENRLYHGLELSTGNYAFATDFGGVVIINKKGQLIQVLNKKSGLKNETVNYLMEDNLKNLWISLNIGIANVELSTPITHFGEDSGIEDIVLSIIRFKDRIYVGTMQGVFYLVIDTVLTKERIPHYMFNRVQGLFNSCMGLNVLDGHLYACSQTGLFEITESGAEMIHPMDIASQVYHYQYDPTFLFVGSKEGLHVFKKEAARLIWLGKVDGIMGARTIIEDSNSRLWITDIFQKTMVIDFGPSHDFLHPEIIPLDTSHGLPSQETAFLSFDSQIFGFSVEGCYAQNMEQTADDQISFSPNNMFPLPQTNGRKLLYFQAVRVSKDSIWINGSNGVAQLLFRNGKYELNEKPFQKLQETMTFAIFPDSLTLQLWIGGSDGLFCYRPDIPINYSIPSGLILKTVKAGSDSLIYAGLRNEFVDPNSRERKHKIEFQDNTLSFEFVLPYFSGEPTTQYSYRLVGFTDSWSEWGNATIAIFTSVSAGKFIFQVKAKTIFHVESSIVSFPIEVLKPWYQSVWAYVLFFVLSALIIYLFLFLNSKRLKSVNLKLERTIADRTFEVNRQKEEIELKNQELEIINAELEKLSTVARETDNAIMIMDTRGYFEWINEGFTRMYGYTLNELITYKSINIIDYSSNPNILEILTDCVTHGKSVIYESFIITKAGSEIWTQTTLTPIFNSQKQIIKIIAIDSDIDQLKLAEREIQQQNEEIKAQKEQLEENNRQLEKLSIVASKTENAVIIMDAEGNFEWINESLTRLYGFTLEEFLAEKGRNLISSSSNSRIQEIVRTCISEKKTVVYESLTRIFSGETIWTQTTLTPILDDKSVVTRLVAIDTDITKIKRAELEILKQKEQIEAQSSLLGDTNEELNTTNILLTDSIQYAKRIQEALLPPESILRNNFKDFFLFFRPRDIVSGDFYWLYKYESKIFIAVADCTGHGVPGAFMAVIGNMLLNEIIKEQKLYDPAEILTTLNTKLTGILTQGGESVEVQDDGMDIAIACYDTQRKSLEISSANLTAYFLREEIITEIGANVNPIGGILKRKSKATQYSNQSFPIYSGDKLYMFSDGFQDQFGGPENKKFMGSRFLQMIYDNRNLSLKEQERTLMGTFELWKGSKKQIDDVLVVGLNF